MTDALLLRSARSDSALAWHCTNSLLRLTVRRRGLATCVIGVILCFVVMVFLPQIGGSVVPCELLVDVLGGGCCRCALCVTDACCSRSCGPVDRPPYS